MPDRTVAALLNIDGDPAGFADTAFAWIDGLFEGLEPGSRRALAALPARFPASGPPGELFAQVWVWRTRASGRMQELVRNGSDAGLAWLRRTLTDDPFDKVGLWVGNRDERSSLAGVRLEMSAEWVRQDAGEWLTLMVGAPEAVFRSADGGPARWLARLWPYADRLNPAYGQFGYWYDGRTALEECLYPHPVRFRDPDHTVGRARLALRGYDWLTIVPADLVPALGGGALAASGAFAEVRELSGGAVWLLATGQFGDYDHAAVQRVFRAVAPVLPALAPAQPPPRGGVDYYPVVFAHPDQVSAR